MFTQEDALKAIAEKFPTETIREKDYINGGFKDVVWTPEKRLQRHYIELHEPVFNGLKNGAPGLDEKTAEFFLRAVEISYKDAHNLPR